MLHHQAQQGARRVTDPHLRVADAEHIVAAQIALAGERAAVEAHHRPRRGLHQPQPLEAPDRQRRSGLHTRDHDVRSRAADRERFPEHTLAGGLAHTHLPPRPRLHRHAVVHDSRWARSS